MIIPPKLKILYGKLLYESTMHRLDRSQRTRSDDRSGLQDSTIEFLREPEPMIITAGVSLGIERTVGNLSAEQGGAIGGMPGGPVSRFQFDASSTRTGVTYTPDIGALNNVMKRRWNPRGIRLRGFVHSHPAAFDRPSAGDVRYASQILDAIDDLEEILIPIVQSAADGVPYSLNAYRASPVRGTVAVQRIRTVTLPSALQDPTELPMFDRVTEAYDLRSMGSTRLVVVGVGGAAAFVEDMVRAGIGEIVLIDPDRVELPNLATQQVYRRDLGRSKVDAVADRVLDINPSCRVWTIPESTDALTDADFRRLISGYLPGSVRAQPELTIICGFTDSFDAQARVNRLALQFGVPMLAAQVYHEGRGAEVTFSAPGITPACGRCVLGGRYRAYLEQQFRNEVGSFGTPLVATSRLNATKASVALALIHGLHPSADPCHPGTSRWADALERIAERNLIQIRMDPDIDKTVGLSVFERTFADADRDRIVFDETVWLPQEPESPTFGFAPCPDCGGTGDLTKSAGAIADTRIIPTVWTG